MGRTASFDVSVLPLEPWLVSLVLGPLWEIKELNYYCSYQINNKCETFFFKLDDKTLVTSFQIQFKPNSIKLRIPRFVYPSKRS